MLARIKLFLFLFALQYSPSWLIPLETNAVSSSSANNSEILEPVEQIAPNNTKNTEIIQQIDVKDDEDQVISNINQIVIGDDAITTNGRINNGTRTTNVPGLDNQLANETQTEVLNNNSTLETDSLNNTDHANSNLEENPVDDEEVSNAEAPAFRSLIPKKRKSKVTDIVTKSDNKNHNLQLKQDSNESKDHNLVLNLSPITPPLTIDLNHLPLSNLLEIASGFMKRFTRNAEPIQTLETNCKTTEKTCKKTIQTMKSVNDMDSSNLKDNKPLARICALSIMAKVAVTQVLHKIAQHYPDGLLNQIITSFRNDKEDSINLFSKELSGLPIPIQIRLQLVQGKTNEFLKRLLDYVDEKLCSLQMSQIM